MSFVTPKGYIQIRGGEYRGEYEHRVVMSKMVKEWCYYPLSESRLGIPEGFHVHHVDGDKGHNCSGNLLLIQDVIHDAFTADSKVRCPYTGRYLNEREVRVLYGDKGRKGIEEVPF